MSYSINKIINTGDLLKITKPNGDVIYIEIDTIGTLDGNGQTDEFTLKTKTHNFAYDLNWHNCYSFGNGVESTKEKERKIKCPITTEKENTKPRNLNLL
jgi:hypothetical protein